MTTAPIAFLGLGNMGGPMAINLAKAGHIVRAFDLSADACARMAEQPGVRVPASAAVSATPNMGAGPADLVTGASGSVVSAGAPG